MKDRNHNLHLNINSKPLTSRVFLRHADKPLVSYHVTGKSLDLVVESQEPNRASYGQQLTLELEGRVEREPAGRTVLVYTDEGKLLLSDLKNNHSNETGPWAGFGTELMNLTISYISGLLREKPPYDAENIEIRTKITDPKAMRILMSFGFRPKSMPDVLRDYFDNFRSRKDSIPYEHIMYVINKDTGRFGLTADVSDIREKALAWYLPVAGYVQDGAVFVPDFGTFIKPSSIEQAYTKIQYQFPEVELLEADSTFMGSTLTDPSTSRWIMHTLARKGVFAWGIVLDHEKLSQYYEYLFSISYDGKPAIVRKSRDKEYWNAYILTEVVDGKEGKQLACSMIAPHWPSEHGVAVIDGIWTSVGYGIPEKQALYKAMEYDMAPTHRILRLCKNGISLSTEGAFYAQNGHREMSRNLAGYVNPAYRPPGRQEMVKILHPAFDLRLIDTVGCR